MEAGLHVIGLGVPRETHRRGDRALVLYNARVPGLTAVRSPVGHPHRVESQLLHPVDVGQEVLRHAVAALAQSLRGIKLQRIDDISAGHS